MLELGLKFTLAYGLGAVMGSLVVGYLRGGVDIRTVGSGNPGGTNALRTQGKVFALGVMIIDVGKGILAVAVLPLLAIPGLGLDPEVPRELVVYAVGLAAVLGHVFPIWFGFRGGKGGATAAGLLCYFSPVAAAVVIGVWLGIVFFSGYVGIATVTGAITAAVYVGLTGLPGQEGLFAFACLTAVLIAYTHRGNLKRMLAGTESRFGRYFGLK
jgi:acyl phosphate:glycerol-3-phosphate acyltransferase